MVLTIPDFVGCHFCYQAQIDLVGMAAPKSHVVFQFAVTSTRFPCRATLRYILTLDHNPTVTVKNHEWQQAYIIAVTTQPHRCNHDYLLRRYNGVNVDVN